MQLLVYLIDDADVLLDFFPEAFGVLDVVLFLLLMFLVDCCFAIHDVGVHLDLPDVHPIV